MISAVVPARNESATVSGVVKALLANSLVGEVIVIDNGSTDETSYLAEAAGARVLHCPEVGLGRAMKLGILSAKHEYVLRSDADIKSWRTEWVDKLFCGKKQVLMRAVFHSPYDSFPVNNLVVRPFFQLYRPEWDHITLPLSGTYLFHRDDFNIQLLPDNWAIDIAILTSALTQNGYSVENVDIGMLDDRVRPMEHYVPMAKDINEYLTCFFFQDISLIRSSAASVIRNRPLRD